MADITGVTNLSSSSNGSTSLAGIKSAVGNLNSDKVESSILTAHTAATGNAHGISGSFVGHNDTQTLTNKTISGASNTLTVREADLSTTDVTTGNATTSKHGFLPKLSGNVSTFLNGNGGFTGLSITKSYLTDTGTYSSTANSLTEITTNWRLAFTPASATSKLILTASYTINRVADTQICLADFYDVTNAVAVGSGSATGSRRAANIAFRSQGTDANDSGAITMQAVISSGSTSARTYTIRWSHETSGSTTTYFNYTASNTAAFGWNTPFTFTIEEIPA